MHLFAIYGNPVHHSKSPLMHNHVFKKLGFKGCYTRILLEDGTTLKEDFFQRGLSGANVTVPHKEAAFQACDEVRGFAQKVGVVNTLINENGRLIGYNTDADGFMYAMQSFYTPIKKVLVLGAGGTSIALVTRLLEEALEVTVINRSAKRLEAFADLDCLTSTWEAFRPTSYDLILNTTSAGLEDYELPAPLALLEKVAQNTPYAADVIYGKITPFLALMQKLRLKTIDGKAMLIGQGVLANEYFTDHRFTKERIQSLMLEAISFS